MPTIDHRQENDQSERSTASLDRALAQKREEIAGAIADAPRGRHLDERDSLQAAQERLAGRADEADRGKVDAFFQQQRSQLDEIQRAELDLGGRAVASSGSIDHLSSVVDTIGDLHRSEHERLAEQRAALEQVLSVEDAAERGAQVDDLLRRQDQGGAALRDALDTARLDAAFAEGPGGSWGAAEVEQRIAAGAVDELGRMEPAARSADEADNDNRHRRGNFGERAATEALAAEGYSILDYKPDIGGTTKGGIDMVAMKDDTVYLLDNKALSRAGDVNSVSALTANFADREAKEGNLSAAKRALEAMADDTRRSADELDLINRAIAALEEGRYVRAVTNANVARDDRILEGVTERLAEQQIQFIDVMRRPEQELST